jgi:hypothetical protein
MTSNPEAAEAHRAGIDPDFMAQLEQIAARPGPHGPRVLISPALARDLLRALAAREWQPVSTAPAEQHVFVYGEKIRWRGPTIGYLHRNFNGHGPMWTLDGRAGSVCSDVTHWHPLPDTAALAARPTSASGEGK